MPVAHRSTCEYSAALSSEFWQVPTVERVRSILGQSERGRTERCNAAALTHKLAPRAARECVPDTPVCWQLWPGCPLGVSRAQMSGGVPPTPLAPLSWQVTMCFPSFPCPQLRHLEIDDALGAGCALDPKWPAGVLAGVFPTVPGPLAVVG